MAVLSYQLTKRKTEEMSHGRRTTGTSVKQTDTWLFEETVTIQNITCSFKTHISRSSLAKEVHAVNKTMIF